MLRSDGRTNDRLHITFKYSNLRVYSSTVMHWSQYYYPTSFSRHENGLQFSAIHTGLHINVKIGL